MGICICIKIVALSQNKLAKRKYNFTLCRRINRHTLDLSCWCCGRGIQWMCQVAKNKKCTLCQMLFCMRVHLWHKCPSRYCTCYPGKCSCWVSWDFAVRHQTKPSPVHCERSESASHLRDDVSHLDDASLETSLISPERKIHNFNSPLIITLLQAPLFFWILPISFSFQKFFLSLLYVLISLYTKARTVERFTSPYSIKISGRRG